MNFRFGSKADAVHLASSSLELIDQLLALAAFAMLLAVLIW
jgi:hypothetical protein